MRSVNSTLQITFDFPATEIGAHRTKQTACEASTVVVRGLDRPCGRGHSMAAEATVLLHAEHDSNFSRAEIFQGLRLAIRQRQIAREHFDGVEWLFPRAVRDAELTVGRCIRQLAEGPSLARSERARLEKVSLLCSPAPLAAIDVLRTMLIRLDRMNCWPTLLVAGTTEAQWYRWRLGCPVLECGEWLRHGDGLRNSTSHAADRTTFVLLDASRLGIESMAQLLEAIAPESGLILVGNPNESPTSGRGQPFRDLLSTALFQTVSVANVGPRVENLLATAPARRSALCWRLRRGAGLRSDFRWGPIATIEIDERTQENRP